MSAETIGYVRVSTNEQAEEGYGIQDQVNRLEKLVDEKDYDFVDIVKDKGKSGTNMDRNGLQKILKLAKNEEIDCIAVIRLDRLSRDMLDTFHLLWVFRKHGVEVVMPE